MLNLILENELSGLLNFFKEHRHPPPITGSLTLDCMRRKYLIDV